MNFVEIRDKIKENNATSKVQADKYESIGAWSFAYLCRWTVLELGLKEIYNNYNKERIRSLAKKWIDYIDGLEKTAPPKITDFSVQTKNIPKIKVIKECIGVCNIIEDILDSNKKFRPKRNQIAHTAVEFKSRKVYDEFRKIVDKAITQMITKLSVKINSSNITSNKAHKD